MGGNTIDRSIERLLTQVQAAVEDSDWALVERRAREILALAPHHTEATQYLAASGRMLRFGPAPDVPWHRRVHMPRRPAMPRPSLPAPSGAMIGAAGGLLVVGFAALFALVLLSRPTTPEPVALTLSPPPGPVTPFLPPEREETTPEPTPMASPEPTESAVLAGATPEPTPEPSEDTPTPTPTTAPRRTATPRPTAVPCGSRAHATPDGYRASLAIAFDAESGDDIAAFQSAPFTAYGSDACASSTVEAFVKGKSCGSVVADGNGRWLMQIGDSSPCSPQKGDTITFTLDGQATAATETYAPGGAPKNVTDGVSLT
jgi:hypothetical protein